MPEPGDEIECQLKFRNDDSEKSGWLVISLDVGDSHTLAMIPNPLAPRSVITPAAFDRLTEQGLVSAGIHDIHTRAKSCLLRNLTIEGHWVPDLEVRIRRQAAFLRADGYLGQDFLFRHFTDLHLDVDRRILRLRLRRDS